MKRFFKRTAALGMALALTGSLSAFSVGAAEKVYTYTEDGCFVCPPETLVNVITEGKEFLGFAYGINTEISYVDEEPETYEDTVRLIGHYGSNCLVQAEEPYIVCFRYDQESKEMVKTLCYDTTPIFTFDAQNRKIIDNETGKTLQSFDEHPSFLVGPYSNGTYHKCIFTEGDEDTNNAFGTSIILEASNISFAEPVNDKSDLLFKSGADVSAEITAQPETSLGDINGDGKLDIIDLTDLSLNLLGEKTLNAVQLSAADVDTSGTVDIADLALLKQGICDPAIKFGK